MGKTFIDQMNRTIRLEGIPRRIVSLVPSQTELLYDLGLNDEVVGITKFCIYPDSWFHSKTRVGGTKQVNIAKVRELKPDLIIGNKEENTKEDIAELEKVAPVWMSDIYTIDDALEMILQVGELTGTIAPAEKIISDIRFAFSDLKKPKGKFSVLYFIWKDPYFAVGKNTFIDDMIKTCGLVNLCTHDRYPEWELSNLQPDFVFLSTEPYPFKEEHIDEVQKNFPTAKILLVDGEMFSWYGSRMRLAPNYFNELISQITP
jgi:ABC-type Fe3+-hydroxamate transport system substrate-binding protein